MNILIVDDNALNRKLIRVTLEAECHCIHEATDGEDALTQLEQQTIDLVISDILMPRQDGYRLCASVRASPRFRNLPIIVYSATYTSETDQELALRLGADQYVKKSAPIKVLLEAIQKSCSEEAHQRRSVQSLPEELTVLREYSAVLVHKLEERNAELEETQQALAATNENLEKRVLERTSELEASNRELEAFSYSVSHDLRAPLRHIDGFAGVIQRTATGTLNFKNQRHLDMICDAARRMGMLIDHLLAFARMNRTKLRGTRIDLNAMVEAAIGNLVPETQGRSITWKVAPLSEITADSCLLRQVWTNLISNAIKYTGRRASAEIEIGEGVSNDTEHVFFVRDNGVGFDMQYAHKLFGVFQRLHRPEEFEGTGIGLANVRRIVSRHGGRTWAEGKCDLGATFYFTLPKKPRVETGFPFSTNHERLPMLVPSAPEAG